LEDDLVDQRGVQGEGVAEIDGRGRRCPQGRLEPAAQLGRRVDAGDAAAPAPVAPAAEEAHLVPDVVLVVRGRCRWGGGVAGAGGTCLRFHHLDQAAEPGAWRRTKLYC